jgi:uncharacterized membrane protein
MKFFFDLIRIGHYLNKKNWNTIGNNPLHIITIIQFPIQLIAKCTIHHSLGLTIDCLAFDPKYVIKHGWTYKTLLKIHSKKQVYIYFSQYVTFFSSKIYCLKKKKT